MTFSVMVHPAAGQFEATLVGAPEVSATAPTREEALELYKDPEIDDWYLTLYVRKDNYEADILNRLESISERFNAQLEEIPGYFLLATDFSQPRGKHAV